MIESVVRMWVIERGRERAQEKSERACETGVKETYYRSKRDLLWLIKETYYENRGETGGVLYVPFITSPGSVHPSAGGRGVRLVWETLHAHIGLFCFYSGKHYTHTWVLTFTAAVFSQYRMPSLNIECVRIRPHTGTPGRWQCRSPLTLV